MTTPYTYLLKHIPTGKFYYGCRFAEGCHPSDFWVSYKTSSKYVKMLVDEYGSDTFVFEIRKTFDKVIDARMWETKVLKRLDVTHRDDFLNRTDNISIAPSYGADNPSKRPDVRVKLSMNNPSRRPEIKLLRRQQLLDNNPAKREDVRLKMKVAASNRTRMECPHCKKSATPGMFTRWHGDNCKLVSSQPRHTPTEVKLKHSATVRSDEWKKDHYKFCSQCNKLVDPGNFKKLHGDKCKY